MASDSVTEIAARIRARESSALEELAAARQTCERHNEVLNAFVHFDWSAAESAAREVDDALERGDDVGPLAGVPFGVKDLQDVAGMPTRFGSKIHAGDPPAPTDSPSVARIRAAGAVAIGKTATAEWGMDAATATVAHGVTRNPWSPAVTPSGSSGGSAAAVSAGMVSFATGSDGGGSIRTPAAFCGLVGLKPTHGLVPCGDGSSDIGVEGVLTRTVEDTALLLELMRGPHPRDKHSQLGDRSATFVDALETLDVAGLRACWSPDLGHALVEPEIARHCESAARQVADAAGLELVEDTVSIEPFPEPWNRIASARFLNRVTALGIWPTRQDELGPVTRHCLEYASTLTPGELGEAEIARSRIEAQVGELFSRVDLLITPTAACDPFPAEGPMPDTIAGKPSKFGREPYTMAVGSDPFTMLANLSWQPAIAIPAGLSSAGLPIGLQIHARWRRDDVLLRLARIWEQTAPWPRCAPGY